MLVRIAVALSAVAFAVPALAEPLSAEAARRFVAGKQFSFTCFEGTVGSGRIFSDGSVDSAPRERIVQWDHEGERAIVAVRPSTAGWPPAAPSVAG